MSIIYYLPPKQPGTVWLGVHNDKDKSRYLSVDGGVSKTLINEEEEKDIIQKQHEIYKKLYPNLVSKNSNALKIASKISKEIIGGGRDSVYFTREK